MGYEITFCRVNNCVTRTVIMGGQSWWIVRDVCSALGWMDCKELFQYVAEEDSCVVSLNCLGVQMDMRVISSVGLCTLLLFFSVIHRQFVLQKLLVEILYLHCSVNKVVAE